MFFKIVKLLVVSSAFITLTCGQESPCVGCPAEHDVNDPEVHSKLTEILAKANPPHEVKRVISILIQVVAGRKYIVKFENQDGNECNASWVEQAWISKEPQYVKVCCP